MFGTTTTRTGPQGDVVLNQSSEATQYGPGSRKMGNSDDQTTLLGQMAKMLKPRKVGEADPDPWSTAIGGIRWDILLQAAMSL